MNGSVLITVGRIGCDIIIDDSYVSRHHLDIVYTKTNDDEFYTIINYGNNGVQVNDKILRGKGERISISSKNVLSMVVIVGCTILEWGKVEKIIALRTRHVKECYPCIERTDLIPNKGAGTFYTEEKIKHKNNRNYIADIINAFTISISNVTSKINHVINTIATNKPKHKERIISYSPTYESSDNLSVYSSIFAPAEVKKKSYLQVQVFLHLYDEAEDVKLRANESDKDAVRRGYKPLSLILRKGDKVDVEFNVYGGTLLMSERQSIIWNGSLTDCCFDYFVSDNLDVYNLSCRTNFFVNGALVGNMRFITKIVETPKNITPIIISENYKKIFISYAHKDFDKVKFMARAYKAIGVDYFFDRDYLKAGDIYPKIIKDYISTSDLFILCWSENAAKSEYVGLEKSQALAIAKNTDEKNGTLTIHPLSIEPRADLPNDMKEIYNFEEL